VQQIIDTHIHVWNFEKALYPWLDGNTSILNRTYQIEEIEKERSAANITGGVLVQASNNLEDTDWMLEVAENTDWIKGVVGWLPLMNPSATKSLLEEKYLNQKYFKGVRHLIHDEADPEWLLQPQVIESLRLLASFDLTYDVVGVLPEHIKTVLKVAEKVPGLKMIFDHLNQPPIQKNERFGEWGELMKTAAAHKNFFAKISGLGTTTGKIDGWNAADVKPYVSFVLEHFGYDRCFCGGDWPVSLLAASYEESWNCYQELMSELLSGENRQKVFYDNAERFYKLKSQLTKNNGGN
jgi:L-fuconolactonase